MTTNRSPARATPRGRRFPSGTDCSLEVTLDTDLFLDSDADETVTSLTCRIVRNAAGLPTRLATFAAYLHRRKPVKPGDGFVRFEVPTRHALFGDAYLALMDPRTFDWRASVVKALGRIRESGYLVIGPITVAKRHRTANVDLAAVYRLLDLFSLGCGVAIYGPLPPERATDALSLREALARVGFQPLPRTTFMALNLAKRRPDRAKASVSRFGRILNDVVRDNGKTLKALARDLP